MHSEVPAECRNLLSLLLHPKPIHEFVTEFWQRRSVVFNEPQASQRRRTLFSELNITPQSLLDLTRTVRGLKWGSQLNAARTIDGRRTTFNGPTGSHANPTTVSDLFANGATFQFLHPQQNVPSIASLCAHLEEVFGCIVGSNAYLTPPPPPGTAVTQGFAPHGDDVDVFVLQLHGCKRWTVCDLPYNDSLPRESSPDYAPGTTPPVSFEVVLMPGDVLYMPRGAVHCARTESASTAAPAAASGKGGRGRGVTSSSSSRGVGVDAAASANYSSCPSLHLTVSTFQQWTWADLLETAAPAAVVAAAQRIRRLRQGLPFRFGSILGSGPAALSRTETVPIVPCPAPSKVTDRGSGCMGRISGCTEVSHASGCSVTTPPLCRPTALGALVVLGPTTSSVDGSATALKVCSGGDEPMLDASDAHRSGCSRGFGASVVMDPCSCANTSPCASAAKRFDGPFDVVRACAKVAGCIALRTDCYPLSDAAATTATTCAASSTAFSQSETRQEGTMTLHDAALASGLLGIMDDTLSSARAHVQATAVEMLLSSLAETLPTALDDAADHLGLRFVDMRLPLQCGGMKPKPGLPVPSLSDFPSLHLTPSPGVASDAPTAVGPHSSQTSNIVSNSKGKGAAMVKSALHNGMGAGGTPKLSRSAAASAGSGSLSQSPSATLLHAPTMLRLIQGLPSGVASSLPTSLPAVAHPTMLDGMHSDAPLSFTSLHNSNRYPAADFASASLQPPGSSVPSHEQFVGLLDASAATPVVGSLLKPSPTHSITTRTTNGRASSHTSRTGSKTSLPSRPPSASALALQTSLRNSKHTPPLAALGRAFVRVVGPSSLFRMVVEPPDVHIFYAHENSVASHAAGDDRAAGLGAATAASPACESEDDALSDSPSDAPSAAAQAPAAAAQRMDPPFGLSQLSDVCRLVLTWPSWVRADSVPLELLSRFDDLNLLVWGEATPQRHPSGTATATNALAATGTNAPAATGTNAPAATALSTSTTAATHNNSIPHGTTTCTTNTTNGATGSISLQPRKAKTVPQPLATHTASNAKAPSASHATQPKTTQPKTSTAKGPLATSTTTTTKGTVGTATAGPSRMSRSQSAPNALPVGAPSAIPGGARVAAGRSASASAVTSKSAAGTTAISGRAASAAAAAVAGGGKLVKATVPPAGSRGRAGATATGATAATACASAACAADASIPPSPPPLSFSSSLSSLPGSDDKREKAGMMTADRRRRSDDAPRLRNQFEGVKVHRDDLDLDGLRLSIDSHNDVASKGTHTFDGHRQATQKAQSQSQMPQTPSPLRGAHERSRTTARLIANRQRMLSSPARDSSVTAGTTTACAMHGNACDVESGPAGETVCGAGAADLPTQTAWHSPPSCRSADFPSLSPLHSPPSSTLRNSVPTGRDAAHSSPPQPQPAHASHSSHSAASGGVSVHPSPPPTVIGSLRKRARSPPDSTDSEMVPGLGNANGKAVGKAHSNTFANSSSSSLPLTGAGVASRSTLTSSARSVAHRRPPNSGSAAAAKPLLPPHSASSSAHSAAPPPSKRSRLAALSPGAAHPSAAPPATAPSRSHRVGHASVPPSPSPAVSSSSKGNRAPSRHWL